VFAAMTASARDLAFRVAVVALAAGCLAGLVHVLSVIGLQVPFDPDEGWNAVFAHMAMVHGTPYPPEESFLVNNYPPLSFFVIGELGRLVGDKIFAGRMISVLALLATALGIGVAAARMGCSKVQAGFAGLLFTACVLLTSDYAGMNDPQLLAHAVAIWALVVVLGEPRTSRTMVIAALVLSLAFFVKHNLIFLPLSLAAWLLLVDRRHAMTFFASGLIFFLIGAGMFRGEFGISFFHQIVSARVYAFSNMRDAVQTWLLWAIVPITGGLLLFFTSRRDRFAVLAVIYAGASTLGGLLFLGGAGVDANALFDADIALALCAGLLLDRLESPAWSAAAAAVYLVPLVLLLRTVEGDWAGANYWLHPLAEDRATSASEIALLRAGREPVLCEMLSLCYWAGKEPQVDVFNTDQRLRTGAQSPDRLLHLIADRRFSIIQLETLHPFPLPPQIERAVLQNYRVVRTDDERVFLAPR
jgi:hypothetical protein